MVAANLGLRAEALPLMNLFDAVLKREIRLLFLKDNQATLRIITMGKNQLCDMYSEPIESMFIGFLRWCESSLLI